MANDFQNNFDLHNHLLHRSIFLNYSLTLEEHFYYQTLSNYVIKTSTVNCTNLNLWKMMNVIKKGPAVEQWPH